MKGLSYVLCPKREQTVMTKNHQLKSSEARRIILSAQGLNKKDPFGKGKIGTLRTIQHLGYIQIDTISVVARAHHHTLWNRVSNYKQKHLESLLNPDHSIFEYWSHALSYLPIKDYRFSLRSKENNKTKYFTWLKANEELIEEVYNRIVDEGPLMARDFEYKRPSKGSGWFDWKPAKIALERLFMSGRLMTSSRRGFHKVYDLPERILDPNMEISIPSLAEEAVFLINKTIQAQGIATIHEICYLRKGIKGHVKEQLINLVKSNKIIPVQIENAPETYYTTDYHLGLKYRVQKSLYILSPFDNLVIQRKRMKKIFNFDYQIECYVPAKKRKFGYFCLPILYGDLFVGRIDLKADRKSKTLLVKSFYRESLSKKFLFPRAQFIQELEKFASFNGCDKIENFPVLR